VATDGPDGAALPLTISLFGPLRARVHGEPLPRLRSRKGYWLLALLVLRAGMEVERGWLAGTLWPASPEPQSFASLRNSLKDLRRALGPEAHRLRSPERASNRAPRTLSLDLSGATVDLLAFDRAIARGDPASLEAAGALYRGPLLEGCDAEWVFPERRLREEGYLGALECLARQAWERGERETAERHLRRVVEADPLRETAHRARMQALAAAGNYPAALMAYRELRLRLHRELNAEPDPETTAQFQQIRAEAQARARALTSSPVSEASSLHHSATTRSPADRTPFVSPDPAPNHLPHPATRFIGRETEMAEVKRLLDGTRLLTLTGAGGRWRGPRPYAAAPLSAPRPNRERGAGSREPVFLTCWARSSRSRW
jgi:DNA-binding SARP family transcriptional activator